MESLPQSEKKGASVASARDMLLRLGDGNELAWKQLISALAASGEVAEGLKAARQAEAALPGKFIGALCIMLERRAREFDDQERPDEGRALIDEMIERFPTAVNHHRAGNYYFLRLHDDHKGFEHYQRCLALAPVNPWIQASLGVLLYRRGEHAEAADLLRAAFTADPSDSFRAFHCANCLLEMRQGGEAEQVAFTSIERAARPTDALHLLGHLYHDLGRLDDALAAFRATLLCSPGMTKLHYDLFKLEMDRGDVDAARAHLDQGLASNPACRDCQAGRVELALHTGRFDEAKRLLDDARSQAPRDIQFQKLAALCAAAAGDLDSAEQQLREVVRARPFHDTAWFELGQILERAGRRRDAIEALEESLRRNANHDLKRVDLLEALLREVGDARATEIASRRATIVAELSAARAALRGFSQVPPWKLDAKPTLSLAGSTAAGRVDFQESIRRLQQCGLLHHDQPLHLPARMPHPGDDPTSRLSFFRVLLAGVDLADLTLPRAFLSRSEFRNTSFRNTDARESYLCWSDFVDVDFTDAILSGADLRASVYTRVQFVRANLRDADLRRSRFEGCSFEGATMVGARLTRGQAARMRLDALQEAAIAWCSEGGPEPSGG